MFYTYLYLREDGTPYYVGKGSGRRAYNSNRRVARPKNDAFILVQEFPSEVDAFNAEEFLIEYYGREDLGTGMLLNMTDGGEGASGHILSEECRRKIGLAHLGRKRPEEAIKHMREARIGRTYGPHSEIQRAKISKALKGISRGPMSASHKEAIRKAKVAAFAFTPRTRNELGRFS